jgi:hypothetical protein
MHRIVQLQIHGLDAWVSRSLKRLAWAPRTLSRCCTPMSDNLKRFGNLLSHDLRAGIYYVNTVRCVRQAVSMPPHRLLRRASLPCDRGYCSMCVM